MRKLTKPGPNIIVTRKVTIRLVTILYLKKNKKLKSGIWDWQVVLPVGFRGVFKLCLL